MGEVGAGAGAEVEVQGIAEASAAVGPCRTFWPVVTPFDLRAPLVGHKTKLEPFADPTLL